MAVPAGDFVSIQDKTMSGYMGVQVLEAPFRAAQEQPLLDTSANLVQPAQKSAFIGNGTRIGPVQASLESNLLRVAIGQSSLFLTTPEASRLALACRDLTTFFESVAAEGGFWNGCQVEPAKYSRGLIWIHPIASLKDAASFAICARSLRLGGGATFFDRSELRSLTHILQTEATYASRVGNVVDTFGKRFLFAWKFDLERMADLLENRSLQEVVSDDVRFRCRYGISFALNLSVSKESSKTSELTFSLKPVKMVGECLSRIEIKACCSIVASDQQRSIVKLKPAFGGTAPPQSPTIIEEECDDCDPFILDSTISAECLPSSRLLSIVRVHIAPVSLTVAPISLLA